MAVPARDVGDAAAFLDFGATDDIFEDFVERVADVELPVCIRGAVMEYKGGLGASFVLLPGVEVVGASLEVFGCVFGERSRAVGNGLADGKRELGRGEVRE